MLATDHLLIQPACFEKIMSIVNHDKLYHFGLGGQLYCHLSNLSIPCSNLRCIYIGDHGAHKTITVKSSICLKSCEIHIEIAFLGNRKLCANGPLENQQL